MDKLYIDYLPLDGLLARFAKRNPKDHDLGAMHTSIGKFGYVAPVMLDESTGRIVAGHGRLLALEQMRKAKADPPEGIREGWAVPVVRGKAFKSEKEAEAYLLADNRLTELGGWNLAEVKDMLADLTVDLGDMDWLGFEWLDGDPQTPPAPKEQAQPQQITCPQCGHQFPQ